jgi:hypothetical protein
MKKYLISTLTITFVVGFLFYGCPKEEEKPPTPSVTATVDDGGGSITYSWNIIDEADGYGVYVDGVLEQELDVNTTTYTVQGPAQEVEIVSYSGDEESDPVTFDYTPVVRQITIYPTSDPSPDHPSGFYFDPSTGEAFTVSVSQNPEDADFVLNDTQFPELTLCGPRGVDPSYNDEYNAVSEPTNTDFDGAENALPEGNYYNQEPVELNNTMYLWITTTDNTWDTGDHFAKIYFPSAPNADGGYTVTVGYQKTGGLRWLKTQ